MGYPSNNVKRRDRRKLGRGQGPFPPSVTTTTTGAGSTMTINFSSPVNVSGTIPATVATRTIVSQTVVSPTQVTILFSGTVATFAWTVPSNPAQVSSYQGGAILGGSGTF